MSIIRFHQDLKVYQKSFDVAMEIYEFQKSFRKKSVFHSATKFEGLPARFRQILAKLGARENIKNRLLQN